MNPDAYRKTPESLSTLTATQRHVTQQDGTEPPFDNAYWDHHGGCPVRC